MTRPGLAVEQLRLELELMAFGQLALVRWELALERSELALAESKLMELELERLEKSYPHSHKGSNYLHT